MKEEIKRTGFEEIDNERVKMARGEAETNLGPQGNNNNEMNQIEEIQNDYDSGKITANIAIQKLKEVWSGKQGM
jgi:hypothetical protein